MFPSLATFLRTACMALLCLLAAPAGAVDVNGLYQGAVEVSSRNDERERQRAFAPALRQVLLKVTGSEDALQHPAVSDALRRAQDFAASWAYRSRTAPEGTESGSSEIIELEVSFFEGAVQDLLKNAGIPLWPQNRPYTLVWAVMQEELGERELLSSSADHPLLQELQDEARRRGVPLVFPLMDLEDRRALSTERLWNLDQDAIRAASQRYQVPSVLVLRVFRSLSGEQLASALYLFRERALGEDIYEPGLEVLATRPLALVARELSGYYGLRQEPGVGGLAVRMLVEGINGAADYAGLLRYLNELSDVSGVDITEVTAEHVALALETGGQIPQLVETIALDRSLEPTAELVREGDGVLLRYRWTGRQRP